MLVKQTGITSFSDLYHVSDQTVISSYQLYSTLSRRKISSLIRDQRTKKQ